MEYVSVAEASRLLGLKYYQVLYRIKTGQLPATKVGWAWVIKKSDLEEK